MTQNTEQAISYECTIRWLTKNKQWKETTVGGCASYERANHQAKRIASENGWKPVRWYQFWRYNHQQITKKVLNEKPKEFYRQTAFL